MDGSRVSKSSARMAAIGDVDEANSAIGLILADVEEAHLKADLQRVQNELFDLGADLATPFDTDFEEHALRMVASQVDRIEHRIDAANADLEPLTSFILPSGSRLVSSLHLARAVTRRAERSAVALQDSGEAVNAHAVAYLNRLSDYLFVLARFVAAGEGGDVLWQPGATRGD